jgi:hypothetical protein
MGARPLADSHIHKHIHQGIQELRGRNNGINQKPRNTNDMQ